MVAQHDYLRSIPIQQLPPQAQLFQMLTGAVVSQAIYAAAKFNVAEHLAAGPMPVDELARKSGADPDALYRLLRALASIGIFSEAPPPGPPRRFANTTMSEFLRPGVPARSTPGH